MRLVFIWVDYGMLVRCFTIRFYYPNMGTYVFLHCAKSSEREPTWIFILSKIYYKTVKMLKTAQWQTLLAIILHSNSNWQRGSGTTIIKNKQKQILKLLFKFIRNQGLSFFRFRTATISCGWVCWDRDKAIKIYVYREDNCTQTHAHINPIQTLFNARQILIHSLKSINSKWCLKMIYPL